MFLGIKRNPCTVKYVRNDINAKILSNWNSNLEQEAFQSFLYYYFFFLFVLFVHPEILRISQS